MKIDTSTTISVKIDDPILLESLKTFLVDMMPAADDENRPSRQLYKNVLADRDMYAENADALLKAVEAFMSATENYEDDTLKSIRAKAKNTIASFIDARDEIPF